jgi:hypothetical protein
MFAQDPQAQGVEGAAGDRVGSLAQAGVEPRCHLFGGLVGEGDGTDPLGSELPGCDEVIDPADQAERLAGAGTREHERGTQRRLYGVLLATKGFEIHHS